MKQVSGTWGLLFLVCACAPSYGSTGVKSPEERIREQEMLAYEDEQRAKNEDTALGLEDDEEDQVGEFDEEQAKLELIRATRSAESCVGVVPEAKERGEAEAMITFAPDGSVTDTSLDPFGDTALGKCAIRAYQAVIVPPFRGGNRTLHWKLLFEDEAKRQKRLAKEEAEKKKAEAEAEKAAEEEAKQKAEAEKQKKKDAPKKEESDKKKSVFY